MAKHNDQAAIKLVERAVVDHPDMEEQLERMKDAYVLKYGVDIDEPKEAISSKKRKKSSN